ncbi:MAG TPA: hypothetical protein VFA90_05365 [Terriglobales bacterium]|nr:hypothetical protein [Terriglobales bacterium]
MKGAGTPADERSRAWSADVSLWSRIIVIFCILLSGCGGTPRSAIGFVNQTKHSDAELWSLWREAQKSLSEQIDLNPLEQELNNSTPHIVPGDARAMSVMPQQVVVSAQPDIAASTLYSVTGTTHSDPTGLIVCPQPCNVDYAPAYSLYQRPTTRYAASWEFAGNNFDHLVEYELENQILSALGYDMRWR